MRDPLSSGSLQPRNYDPPNAQASPARQDLDAPLGCNAQYVLADRPADILDPAVGNGALLKAAKTIAEQAGFSLTCYGTEIDPDVMSQAGLSDDQIVLADFLSYPFQNKFSAIIAIITSFQRRRRACRSSPIKSPETSSTGAPASMSNF